MSSDINAYQVVSYINYTYSIIGAHINKRYTTVVSACIPSYRNGPYYIDVSGGPKPRVRYDHATCCLVGPLTGQEHPLLVMVEVAQSSMTFGYWTLMEGGGNR